VSTIKKKRGAGTGPSPSPPPHLDVSERGPTDPAPTDRPLTHRLKSTPTPTEDPMETEVKREEPGVGRPTLLMVGRLRVRASYVTKSRVTGDHVDAGLREVDHSPEQTPVALMMVGRLRARTSYGTKSRVTGDHVEARYLAVDLPPEQTPVGRQLPHPSADGFDNFRRRACPRRGRARRRDGRLPRR